jgi:hypothetical protein
MRFSKLFALAAMAAGMMLSTTTARAEDRWDAYRDRRDLRHDYARADNLRAAIANDRYRLAEDRRCGRRWAAEQDERALYRDQRALDYQLRDIRHDRADRYSDRRW